MWTVCILRLKLLCIKFIELYSLSITLTLITLIHSKFLFKIFRLNYVDKDGAPKPHGDLPFIKIYTSEARYAPVCFSPRPTSISPTNKYMHNIHEHLSSFWCMHNNRLLAPRTERKILWLRVARRYKLTHFGGHRSSFPKRGIYAW